MTDETAQSAPETPVKTTKKLPTIAWVGIGCVVLLVLAGIVMTFFGSLFATGIGGALLKKGIESKTGVKVDSDKGSMTFTDKETGQTVNVGADQKLPDNFPKDFPIYPGVKFTGSMSGNNQKQDSKGFWVVMSTGDSVDQVKEFYDAQLETSGWEVANTMTAGSLVSWTVKKGTLEGAVSVTRGEQDSETAITVTLGSYISPPDQPQE
ncbi:hypothetical protein A2Z33_01825 [Candidatus Gottesmanbacteria bacterium RBG_16_52_11]|uniref:Uncharacterized protein n=1 Tax=Candidatus Gottesmanbacteria bacterium RBG_16_52_11 TaxID=1798374 RepID=A0A1F5YQW8_9BACT|nr:MAG: hypothetical protein A2Z33_01825 [Candidatus Gottesmanbacteria bacterium RBG_16_52_11]